MARQITNNYAAVCEAWRKRILEMDLQELKQRFFMDEDAEAYYITYYNEVYCLNKENALLTLVKQPDKPLTFNTVMSIYNLFYYSKPQARVRGEFVPFRQVKRAAPFTEAFKRTVLVPLAQMFSGHALELRLACQALGGRRVRQGDVGYVIDAFSCMPVTVLFWDKDDEFEAQANLLFDADITDFIHEETVCCIAADLVRRLAEEADMGKVNQLLGDNY